MLYHSLEELIGHTPLLALERLAAAEGLSASLFAKLEGRNPGGSAKDRVALSMIRDAEEKGLLAPGGTIIEPTSGNTGIGLAAVGRARGYRVIIVMPDSMSRERQLLMKAYGAELILTPGSQGMAGAIAQAEELKSTLPGSILAGQFVNPANPAAHYAATGPEIWADLEGQVDIFIAGVGTGGTLTGAGEYLKAQKSDLHIVAVEPAGSPVLAGGQPGPHDLQGIGGGFIPEVLNTALYDEIVPVKDEEAYAAARRLAATEGILCGISGGAALYAAMALARRPENSEKSIVLILPDSGERYLSTKLYAE